MSTEAIITLAVLAFLGWLGHAMAVARNRNAPLWSVLSVLFGVFAIVVLLLLGKQDAQQ